MTAGMKYCCLSCSVELVLNTDAPFFIKTTTQVELAFATVIKHDICDRCGKKEDLITELEENDTVWSNPN